MAKKIIVLKTGSPWVGQRSITYAMWATVPAGREGKYAQPSSWISAFDGADAAELSDLRSGVLVERVDTTNVPSNAPIATIKSILIDAFNSFQTQITNESTYQFYGTFWDGTTWTNGGL